MIKRFLILLLLPVCLFSQRTKTSATYRAEYDTQRATQPMIDKVGALKLSKADGDMYWAGQFYMKAATEMWQVTGNVTYLDDALGYAEARMNNAMLSSASLSVYGSSPGGGVWFGDEHMTWIGHPRWTGSDAAFPGGNYALYNTQSVSPYGQEYPLDQNLFMRYVTYLLNVIKHSPTFLANNPSYKTRYDALVVFAQEQYNKWYDRTVNDNSVDGIVRSKTHITSHMAAIGLDLYYITGNADYKDPYTAYMDDVTIIPNHSYTGSFKATLRTHADGGYIYENEWNVMTGETDWNHAGNEVSLWFNSVRYGEDDFTTADLQKFGLAFYNRGYISGSNTTQYDNMDGTGSLSADAQTFQGWLLTGAYHQPVLERFETMTINGDSNKCAALGAAAFAAAIADGDTIYYPEVAYQVGPLSGTPDPDPEPTGGAKIRAKNILLQRS